ncbi:helix-turn-helix domain-containing protein [Herbaspirillum sp. 3R11]|uniref:transcriptional regulator n=1 Tax=unclassified Herbaspirillum TaxID=2624150 RepID=UPI000E2F140C|nr:Cro/Cl family transcriptional regulator [Herbaspirillum sp. 3R-3a1]TFI10351.1 helix-turn-helix domain-containing protein [Herbaspirillum sp. 3R11]TFI16255.1 helix-turn-helix domain-containing protein [Herbaspirillum sp. 3R-11]TFI28352.1 helix-turn-helix domain-containing protein [Herbaspirillum sp. 3C11]
MQNDRKTTIEEAVAAVDGPSEMGRRCGVTPQAVCRWLRRGKAPSDRCIAIEVATGGRYTRYVLRPDVFGRQDASGQPTVPADSSKLPVPDVT